MTAGGQQANRSPGPMIAGKILLLSLAVSLVLARAFIEFVGLPDNGMESNAVDNVIGLRNGSTLMVPAGTIGRDIADWLNSDRSGRRTFDVGGRQFVAGSDELTAESRDRLQRLAFMLGANRDVALTVIAPSNSPASRSKKVVDALASDGIPASRLAIRTVAAPAPNGRLSILLTRPAQARPRSGD